MMHDQWSWYFDDTALDDDDELDYRYGDDDEDDPYNNQVTSSFNSPVTPHTIHLYRSTTTVLESIPSTLLQLPGISITTTERWIAKRLSTTEEMWVELLSNEKAAMPSVSDLVQKFN